MVNTRRNVMSRNENRIDGAMVSVTASRNENERMDAPVHPVQPANSRRSVQTGASAAQIAELKGALKEKDDQIAELREIMRAAGLIKDHDINNRNDDETEGESSSKPHKEVNDSTRQGSTFKAFMDCKPPTFKGGEDPLICMRWIRKMNQTFDSGVFTKEQRVRYAIRMLEGEALEWWDSVEQAMTTTAKEELTWETFIGRIRSRFCNTASVQRTERDFLRLEKGSMTIAKYNTTFTEKLQFARRLCPDEVSLITQYVEGLPFEYRATVRNKTTIEAAMEEARQVEDDLAVKDRQYKKGSEKRKWEEPSKFSEKEVDHSRKSKPKFCTKCNSFHRGLCSKSTVGCRRCGKPGHTITDCKSPDPMCYYCKEMGHISFQCPKVPNKDVAGERKATLLKPTARAFQMVADETFPERP